MKKKSTPRFGELPPRYKLFLNPYDEYRFTSCPICEKLTRLRKFPLVIHIKPRALLALNMHCRYCPDCDLLIVHQNELEAQLAAHMAERDPSVIGNEYIVIGTMERVAWRAGMQHPKQLGEMLKYIADFKEALDFDVRPAGIRTRSERMPVTYTNRSGVTYHLCQGCSALIG